MQPPRVGAAVPCELDAVFDHDRTQEEVYAVLAEAAVEDFLRGINATIFAYGQTGTGKTYSMYGSEQVLRDLSRAPPETYGSALKAVLRILAHLSSRPAARLQLAYLEVYNDTINDLLPRSARQAGRGPPAPARERGRQLDPNLAQS